ncbi:MAG: LbtU family siderophore porin [Kiritimatiellales bacterium]
MNRMQLAVAGIGVAITLGAAAQDVPVNKAEFDQLQAEVQELKALLHNKHRDEAAAEKSSSMHDALALAVEALPENFEFGALFEVEGSYRRERKGGDKESDITMATVELSAGWQLLDWLRGDLGFLYEEDDTEPMEVDQAMITIGSTDKFPLYFQAGKMYVPFGNFDTFFITDPVVLELAESRETAALLGFKKGGFMASVSVFNSDVDTEDGGDHIENAVLAASYSMESDNFAFAVGSALIRNMFTADTLNDEVDDFRAAGGNVYLDDDTGGFNAWATLTYGRATLIAEYVKALDAVMFDDGADAAKIKPESFNLELGLEVTDRIGAAVKYERSRRIADIFAKNRCGFVGSYILAENDICTLTASVEYMREDFGAGERDADVVTGQLALEF